jgi:hypothetical protein
MELPPKSIRKQLRDRGESSDEKLPAATRPGTRVVRRGAGALRAGTDNLPVLEAFQQFLDVERRRTRNRILMLSALFFIVLLLVAGAFVFVGLTVLQQMSGEMTRLESELTQVHADARLAQEETGRRVTQLADEERALRRDVDSQAAALDTTRQDVQSLTERYASGIQDIQTVLGMLDLENAMLRETIETMNTQWSSLSGRVARISMPVDSPPPDREADVASRPDTAPAPPPASIPMLLMPPGAERAVSWLVPIPE